MIRPCDLQIQIANLFLIYLTELIWNDVRVCLEILVKVIFIVFFREEVCHIMELSHIFLGFLQIIQNCTWKYD